MEDASTRAEAQRARGSALVKRYFVQLMEGCGRGGCPNTSCRSCLDGHGPLDATRAALLGLELAQRGSHALCNELPPFLHAIYVQELVDAAKQSGDTGQLVREVGAVFSSSDALNRSFLASGARVQEVHSLRLSAPANHALLPPRASAPAPPPRLIRPSAMCRLRRSWAWRLRRWGGWTRWG
jgi:hypothetical protein